jgi:hypothetical protein
LQNIVRMGSAAERSLILAAVLALSAGPLRAFTTAEFWPEFRDVRPEAANAIEAPAAGVLAEAADVLSAQDGGHHPGGHGLTGYSFDLPVDNPAGGASPIKVTDKTNDLTVSVVRKAYGSYEAAMSISGGTASFNVFKLGSGHYLVRSGEVNLLAVPAASGNYYDVSGDIPTPAGETLSFKLKTSTDGALGADGTGYKLTLRRDRVAGEVDTKVFSKADAACLMALGLAIFSDAACAPDPSWVPYMPQPWVHVPPEPGTNDPWQAQPVPPDPAGGGHGGSAGGAHGGHAGGHGGGSHGGGAAGAHAAGGHGGSGGHSAGGHGGGGSHSGGGHRGGQQAFSDAGGGNGGGGYSRRGHSGPGGGYGGGRKHSSSYRSNGEHQIAGRSSRSGSSAHNSRASSSGGRQQKNSGRAAGQKRLSRGSAGGGKDGGLGAGHHYSSATADSRGSGSGRGAGGGRLAGNTDGGAGHQHSSGGKDSAGAGGADKRPSDLKDSVSDGAAHKKAPHYIAPVGLAASVNRQRLQRLWSVNAGGWNKRGSQPPPPDYRDSPNYGPRQEGQDISRGTPPQESGTGLAAVMEGGRRAIAAVAGSVAEAISNWRAAMAVLWAWLKTLI